MEKFSGYKQEKERLQEKLKVMQEKLEQLTQLGINCQEPIQKVHQVLEGIAQDKISIVLAGAFSDGKTSVIAGWLNELCDDMKIDLDESSDELAIYRPKDLADQCFVVDTPGLFGTKEKRDADGNHINLGSITRKYLDEANIILYVVEAKNPIKESHIESLQWILQELNKASYIVFVINKMDEVVDLTDEAEFKKMAAIKRDNVKQKLREMVGLSEDEVDRIRIVCIASNPGGREPKFWQAHRAQYDMRSHLKDLEMAANEILKENTVEKLVLKTGGIALQRILRDSMRRVGDEMEILRRDQLPALRKNSERNSEDLKNVKEELRKIKTRYRDELMDYNKELLGKLDGTSWDTLLKFIREELGYQDKKIGYLFEAKLNNITDKYYQEVNGKIKNLEKSFSYQLDMQEQMLNDLIGCLGSRAAQTMKVQGKGMIFDSAKKGILFARDLLKKAGIVIKFKPWEVGKIANYIDKAWPMIGCLLEGVMDIWKGMQAQERAQKLKECQDGIRNSIGRVFKERYEILNDESRYFQEYAPQLARLEKIVEVLDSEIKEIEDKIAKFENWKKEAGEVFEEDLK